MRTIAEVMNRLGPSDARWLWWRQIKRFIQQRDYGLVLTMLQAHNKDEDYLVQFEIICREIASVADSRLELSKTPQHVLDPTLSSF